MEDNKKDQGFTLIELLVSMTIFAILIGLAMTSYQSVRRSARDGRRKADLEQIRNALEMCYADFPGLGYPSSIYDNVVCGSGAAQKTYLSGTPKDPLSSKYYFSSATKTTYTLCAYLEAGGTSGSCGSSLCGDKTCNYKVTNP